MTKAKVDPEVFAEVYAYTKSPGKAMLAAQPDLVTNKNYANVKAHRMLAKKDVQAKIQENLEKMSKKAIKRIDSLIQSDDESIATTNSWRTIEHLRGKPVARNLNVNATTTIEDALTDL
jgi:hypothetical protein